MGIELDMFRVSKPIGESVRTWARASEQSPLELCSASPTPASAAVYCATAGVGMRAASRMN